MPEDIRLCGPYAGRVPKESLCSFVSFVVCKRMLRYAVKFHRQAADIMDSGEAAYYDTAIAWLREGRDILLKAGQVERWQATPPRVAAKASEEIQIEADAGETGGAVSREWRTALFDETFLTVLV